MTLLAPGLVKEIPMAPEMVKGRKLPGSYLIHTPQGFFTPNLFFFHSSTKTYVVGTQKNCLNETVLLSTQDI